MVASQIITLVLLGVVLLPGVLYALFGETPPRQFPKGHIRAYDPSGKYTYADQNPDYKE